MLYIYAFPHTGSNIYTYINIQYMKIGSYKHIYICVNEKKLLNHLKNTR